MAENEVPPAPRKRTGRRVGSTVSYRLILDAACAEFGRAGYEGTTMRSVAQAAGVDAALIHHFFLSKEGLFAAVIQDVLVPPDLAATALGDRDEVGRRVALAFLEHWESAENNQRLVALLRSVVANEGAASALRALVGSAGLGSVAAALGGSQPDVRAALLGAHLVGIALMRYVIGHEPLASMPFELAVAAAADACQLYLVDRK